MTDDRRNSFDLLRLLAALAVVYTHSLRLFDIGTDPTLTVFPDDLSLFGVLVFFAISGYLVTQSAERSRGYRDFAKKRALRIFPALIACLLVTVLIIGPAATVLPLAAYLSDWISWKYLLNVLLFPLQTDLPGVFADNPRQGTVNGSLWTLSSEVSAYILIGAAVIIRWRPIPVILAGTVFLFVSYTYLNSTGAFPLWYVQQPYGEDGEYFFWLYFNKIGAARLLAVFGVAALLNYLPVRFLDWRIAATALVAMALAARTPLYDLLVVLAVPYAVVAFGRLPSHAADMLRGHDFSYGIYLYHAPLMQLAWVLTHDQMSLAGQVLAGVVLTALAAYLSWNLVEKPALSLKRPRRSVVAA